MTRPRYASVDIGSNSVILLVVEADPELGWVRVTDEVAITRVSEGLDASGVLSEAPIQRTAEKMAEFRRIADELGVVKMIATGTAPFRRSSNGVEVAGRLSEVLGATIDIVSGDEEAELSLLATQRSFPEFPDIVVVDIGGASTEVIVARASGGTEMTSLDIGSVRLTERFVHSDPATADERAALRSGIHAAFEAHGLADALGDGGVPLVGIAGTVTTIAAMLQESDDYDADTIHGCRMPEAAVAALSSRLLASTQAERLEMPGLPAKRADVIGAGSVLLLELMRAASVPEVIVSDRGTRWGRLYRVCGDGKSVPA